jgi:hypothetical protein
MPTHCTSEGVLRSHCEMVDFQIVKEPPGITLPTPSRARAECITSTRRCKQTYHILWSRAARPTTGCGLALPSSPNEGLLHLGGTDVLASAIPGKGVKRRKRLPLGLLDNGPTGIKVAHRVDGIQNTRWSAPAEAPPRALRSALARTPVPPWSVEPASATRSGAVPRRHVIQQYDSLLCKAR